MLFQLVLVATPSLVYCGESFGCWHNFCEGPSQRIPCATDKNYCSFDSITQEPSCKAILGSKPDPVMYCENSFFQECICAHGGRLDWAARCDCKVPISAIIVLGLLGLLLLAVCGGVYWTGKWYLMKREQMICHMERMCMEEQLPGDSASGIFGSNSQAKPRYIPEHHNVRKMSTTLLAASGNSHAYNVPAVRTGSRVTFNPVTAKAKPITSTLNPTPVKAKPVTSTLDLNPIKGYRRKGTCTTDHIGKNNSDSTLLGTDSGIHA